MAEVLVSKPINVSADKVWSKLSAFKGIEEYSPVEICTMLGQGVGATRICYMPGGGVIYEELEKLENVKMELQYKIKVGPFPIKDYVSKIKVQKIGEETCQVTWGCAFAVKPETQEEMENMFEDLFDTIIDGLENLLTHPTETEPFLA